MKEEATDPQDAAVIAKINRNLIAVPDRPWEKRLDRTRADQTAERPPRAEQIRWRRAAILQAWGRGLTVWQIARRLRLDGQTVGRDLTTLGCTGEERTARARRDRLASIWAARRELLPAALFEAEVRRSHKPSRAPESHDAA